MTKKYENKKSPEYLIFGFIFLTIIFVFLFFNGCISINKHKRLKIESERSLAQRFFNSIDKYVSIEDMKYDLKGILDAYDLKLHHTGRSK